MSIQYTVLGFECTTFGTRVSSLNHQTRAPAQCCKIVFLEKCRLRLTTILMFLIINTAIGN